MKKIFLVITILIVTLCGLNAQNIGETWRLSKVQIVEISANNSSQKEILSSDQDELLQFIGPKEIIFLPNSKLSYKRMGEDNFEIFTYAKKGEVLAIELSECLLELTIEAKDSSNSTLLLSERKVINKEHTVSVIYNYIKQGSRLVKYIFS